MCLVKYKLVCSQQNKTQVVLCKMQSNIHTLSNKTNVHFMNFVKLF